VYQPLFAEMKRNIPNIRFVENSLDIPELREDPNEDVLLILDDMMLELCRTDSPLNALFTRGAHHYSISVIYIVQSLNFSGSKCARLNTDYYLLFKTPIAFEISHLARQLILDGGKFSWTLISTQQKR
jgi:hypothetical protein